jgi:hypothetical protein
LRLSWLEIAVLILAAWVFLVNVTYITDTLGWIMGLVAFVLVLAAHRSRA